MKRKIEVSTPEVKITAKITVNGDRHLSRDEVEEIRDQLADRLQEAAAGLRYLGTPRNRVLVR